MAHLRSGSRSVVFGFAAAVVLAAASGCTATLSGQAIQPNPLAVPPEESLSESKHIHIRVRDMDVPRSFKMYNSAWFNVVSKDRLRFHVVLVHKWEEMADPSKWNARLEDDRGRVFYPQEKDKRGNKFTTAAWDTERRSLIYNASGDVVGSWHNIARQTPLDRVDLFKGSGDLVFYAKDLLDPSIKRLTLVMEKGGMEYRFTWHLYNPAEDPIDEDDPPLDEDGNIIAVGSR